MGLCCMGRDDMDIKKRERGFPHSRVFTILHRLHIYVHIFFAYLLDNRQRGFLRF